MKPYFHYILWLFLSLTMQPALAFDRPALQDQIVEIGALSMKLRLTREFVLHKIENGHLEKDVEALRKIQRIQEKLAELASTEKIKRSRVKFLEKLQSYLAPLVTAEEQELIDEILAEYRKPSGASEAKVRSSLVNEISSFYQKYAHSESVRIEDWVNLMKKMAYLQGIHLRTLNIDFNEGRELFETVVTRMSSILFSGQGYSVVSLGFVIYMICFTEPNLKIIDEIAIALGINNFGVASEILKGLMALGTFLAPPVLLGSIFFKLSALAKKDGLRRIPLIYAATLQKSLQSTHELYRDIRLALGDQYKPAAASPANEFLTEFFPHLDGSDCGISSLLNHLLRQGLGQSQNKQSLKIKLH